MKNRTHSIARTFAVLVALVVTVALFIGGYVLSWGVLCKPISEKQFAECEQVARDIYAHKKDVIYEQPEEFLVEVTETSITVSLKDPHYSGKVVATIQEGKLLVSRDLETAKAFTESICTGFIFVLLGILLALIGGRIWLFFKKK